MVLQASNVSRTYGRGANAVVALRGASLDVRRGEFVALMGASGSGKSSFLHILSGLDHPDSGTVQIGNTTITNRSERELAVVRRRMVGFVLQFFNLLPTLTALENVAFPLELDGAKDATQHAHRRLAEVGLGGRTSHRPAELSGGEQQRVALARALVCEPAVVFADEPTGSLDSTTGKEILALLRRTADNGQAIVMATHDASVAGYADRIVNLADGRLFDERQPAVAG